MAEMCAPSESLSSAALATTPPSSPRTMWCRRTLRSSSIDVLTEADTLCLLPIVSVTMADRAFGRWRSPHRAEGGEHG